MRKGVLYLAVLVGWLTAMYLLVGEVMRAQDCINCVTDYECESACPHRE